MLRTLAMAAPMLVWNGAMAQQWLPRISHTKASLRGVSVVDAKTVWASGTGGTYLETTDGGGTWRAGKVTGAEKLDIRGVHGVNAQIAYAMSIGSGDNSRIYKTTDGGKHWSLLFKNQDAKGFFDALAFWDSKHGIAIGDPVDGRFVVLTTTDGEHWVKGQGPKALSNEGAFAASNSSAVVAGTNEIWFGTGGPGAARVFHSSDGGGTWTVATTPIRKNSANAGIFSLAFSDGQHGVAVGGDFSKLHDSSHNVAVTSDGGKTWREASGNRPAGYRSAVAYLPDVKMWIATGPSGSDVSTDEGKTWKQFDIGAYNALGFFSGKFGWAVGAQGHVAEFQSAPAHSTPFRPVR